MPSLGIAPHPGGCVGRPTKPTQDVAPVTGVVPADATLRLLEIGLQAIQLSPYRAGPSAHRPVRLGTAADSWHALVPSSLSASGKPSDPGTSLQVPPSCAGDTARRLAAHYVSSTNHRSPGACRANRAASASSGVNRCT